MTFAIVPTPFEKFTWLPAVTLPLGVTVPEFSSPIFQNALLIALTTFVMFANLSPSPSLAITVPLLLVLVVFVAGMISPVSTDASFALIVMSVPVRSKLIFLPAKILTVSPA